LKSLKLIEEVWEDSERGRFRKASPEKFFKELAESKR